MYGRKSYLKTRVKTARPEDLVVMLYDGMIVRVERIKEAVMVEGSLQDPAQLGADVERVLDILAHLEATLLPEPDPKFAEQLTLTYQLWSSLLVRSRLERNGEVLDGLLTQMEGLRNAWANAAEQLRSEAA